MKKFFEAFKKHTLTGISYMIPIVVAGGICIGLARIFGGTQFTDGSFAYIVNQIGSAAISFSVPVISAGIAFSMAGRPGIAPGLAIGMIANNVSSGFIGGLVGGFLVGFIALKIKENIKPPKSMAGLMPVFIIPVLTTLISGLIFYYIIGKPLALVLAAASNWLISLKGASSVILGFVIGAMRIDMTGPLAQAAYAFSTACISSGICGPMAADLVAGMTPPLGVALAVFMARKRFNLAEREAAKAAIPLGLCFITEGVFPFLATDPLRVILSCTVGSATAGAIVMALGVEAPIPHGGIFAIPFMTNPFGFIIGLVVGTVVTALVLVALKPKVSGGNDEKEKELDFDVNF